jgi:ElaB/YqjD/DUF883 family membrane-anchored ribosome-binding protein
MEDTNTADQDNGNGNGLKERASDKVREISEVARGQAGERVRGLTAKARERAQQQAEDQRERIATRVEGAASGLLQHAEEGDNLRFQAERRLGHSLESAAGYLHSHPTDQVAGDALSYVRQHPFRSMVMAAIIGYLLGKLFG